MSVHFTYSKNPCFDSLRQGDVLKRTPELIDVIEQVHPHYASPEYIFFQVLTQSCDLVSRGASGCKTRYITLAAVRSLKDIIDREVEKIPEQDSFTIKNENFVSESQKENLYDFISKVFNNQHKDYFYLHEEVKSGLHTKCCTLLHLSIAIRSREHYEACLNSKIVELEENFQSRLGWMVGNLYSRVGTKDFIEEKNLNREGLNYLLEDTLTDHLAWVPEKQIKHYKKFLRNEDAPPEFDVVYSKVKGKLETTLQQKISTIASSATKVLDIDNEDERKEAKRMVVSAINNDPNLNWLVDLLKKDISG